MKKFYKNLKYRLEYVIFIIFIWFLKLIGFKNSVNFCAYIARSIGPKIGANKIAKKNMEKVFGTKINFDKTLNLTWDNFGKYIGEFPFIHEFSKAEMNQRCKLTGLKNVADYVKEQKPFLMFLSHSANWDFVIRSITDIYPKFAIIYRKLNNPYVDKTLFSSRNDNKDILMIPKGASGAKDLVKAIKNGYSICMLVDQKMNDGIEVPFFNHPAMTAHAIAKLSLQYKYPIIPCQLIRLENSHFEAIIHPKLECNITENKAQDVYNIMLKINQNIERWIIENPPQWFWFHNRWKN